MEAGGARREVAVRKSIMAGTFPATTALVDQFHLAAGAGFAGIEIGLAREGFFSVDGDPADVDAVARLAHDTGLTISGMLAGPWATCHRLRTTSRRASKRVGSLDGPLRSHQPLA